MGLLTGRPSVDRRGLRWHLLAPLAAVGLTLATTAGAAVENRRVGVTGAVNPQTTGTPPASEMRTLRIGTDIIFEERIETLARGQAHIMFLDGSTLTIGPNSNLVIDRFVYDPDAKVGDLVVSVSKGVFRFVGGRISKTSEVVFKTPSSEIGIRGGVLQAEIDNDTGAATQTFLFGEYMKVRAGGETETVTVPGFAVTTVAIDQPPGSQFKATPQMIAEAMAKTEGQPGATGGTDNPPTDQIVAESGLAVIAADDDPTGAGAPAAGGGQGSGGGDGGTTLDPGAIDNAVDIQQASQNNATQSSGLTLPAVFSGRLKATTAGMPSLGTLDGSAASNRAYSGGTVANGRFQAVLGGSAFDIPVGSPGTPFVFGSAGTTSFLGPVEGTSFISPDQQFFFANLAVAGSDRRAFIFGGVPATGAALQTSGYEVVTFELIPDPILLSNVPFVRGVAGGGIADPTVSPVYVINRSAGGIADNTSPARTSLLQGSLGIQGQGAAQQSVFSVATGALFNNTDTGKPGVVTGIRASARLSATGELTHTFNAIQSVTDDAGNHFFAGPGGDIGYVVLDDARFGGNPSTDTIRVEGTDTTVSFEISEDAQPPGIAVGNNHIASVLQFAPPGIGVSRTLHDATAPIGDANALLNGYAAGTARTTTFGPATLNTPYAFDSGADPETGVRIATFPDFNRASAQFNIAADNIDATGNPTVGFATQQLNFGGTTTAGDIFSLPTGQFFFSTRSSFIDDNLFGLRESVASDGTTSGPTTLRNGVSVSDAKQQMVTQAVVPATNFLPSGVSFCTCAFLKWGYWNARTVDAAQSASDAIHLATWVAGTLPTIAEIPTSGTATYNGHVIGNVVSNGAQYVAAGNFQNAWNFASRTGNVTITSFDGLNPLQTGVAATLSNPRDYTGSTGGIASGNAGVGNVTLQVTGSFFKGGGDPVAETGGTFQINGTGPSGYLAKGTFAGAK